MQDEMPVLEPVDWRRFIQFDAKAVAALLGVFLFLVGFLGILPRWLHGRDQADFAGVATRTVPGIVTVCQISPVSMGGGGLFNAVTVAFDKRQAYYALPPASKWQPIFHQNVRVTYRVGRSSKMVRIDAVTPAAGPDKHTASPSAPATPAPTVPQTPPARPGSYF